MSVKKCRVCNNNLYDSPILVLKNMPKSAQFFPLKKDLNKEKGLDLSVYQCSCCGLIQLMDKPVSYYKQVVRAVGISEEMKKFRYIQFNKFVKKYGLINKKILEIGCGFGEYLSVMNDCKVDAYGIEYSQKAVDYCKKLGLKVYKQFVETDKCKIKNAPFDAFFIMSYLEHIPNINSFLKGINNNLSEDAVGLIEVPNFDMILNENLFSEFISDHLFYFTKDTLKTTLNINGFDVIENNTVWHNYILSAVVRKRKQLDSEKFYEQKNSITEQLNAYIDSFGKNSVAVWGAGHQALAVISLSQIENKIKYVVDSAEFKQNKFTPATHIPVVSSEQIIYNTPEAIIVMAGSYCDEIVKIIKNKYDKNISIAVLKENKLKIIK